MLPEVIQEPSLDDSSFVSGFEDSELENDIQSPSAALLRGAQTPEVIQGSKDRVLLVASPPQESNVLMTERSQLPSQRQAVGQVASPDSETELSENDTVDDDADITESESEGEKERKLRGETLDLLKKRIDPFSRKLSSVTKAELYDKKVILERFDVGIEENSVRLRQVPLDEVLTKEAVLDTKRISDQAVAAVRASEMAAQLEMERQISRKRVEKERQDVLRRNYELRRKVFEDFRLRGAQYRLKFRQEEAALKTYLKRKSALTGIQFSDEVAHAREDSEKDHEFVLPIYRRKVRLEWLRVPQPVRIYTSMLRAVGDKIPSGRYVVLISLISRVGGHPLQWIKLPREDWNGSTMPIDHTASEFVAEMPIVQDIFVALPPKFSVQPGISYLFELFRLRSTLADPGKIDQPVDKVVGWGVFPACDCSFNYIHGPIKVAILRGDVDWSLSTYSRIESLYSSDVDNWLANLYLDISILDRYFKETKEYVAELRLNINETPTKRLFDDTTEEFLTAPATDLDSDDGIDEQWGKVEWDRHLASDSDDDYDEFKPLGKWGRAKAYIGRYTKYLRLFRRQTLTDRESGMLRNVYVSSVKAHGSVVDKVSNSLEVLESSHKRKKSVPKLDIPDLYDGDSDLESQGEPEKDEIPLLYHPVDSFKNHVGRPVPATYGSEVRNRATMYVAAGEKLRFLGRVIPRELGLRWKNYKNYLFYLTFFYVLFSLYVRTYIHGVGEFIFLSLVRFPIRTFSFNLITYNLDYQFNIIPSVYEVGAIVSGTLFFELIFFVLTSLQWISQKLLGSHHFFFSIMSRLMFPWFVIVLFDPLLQLFMDTVTMHFTTGDAFKFYNHFQLREGSGIIGLIVQTIVYCTLSIISFGLLYWYTLYIYCGGRIMDLYQRLSDTAGSFFIPHDFEVSLRQLKILLARCKLTAGDEGRRIRVEVQRVDLRDRQDPKFRGRFIHIRIIEQGLDGTRQLRRHFITSLPSGTLYEVYENREEEIMSHLGWRIT